MRTFVVRLPSGVRYWTVLAELAQIAQLGLSGPAQRTLDAASANIS
ncbi:hypothetical protein [Kribbella endophytica]